MICTGKALLTCTPSQSERLRTSQRCSCKPAKPVSQGLYSTVPRRSYVRRLAAEKKQTVFGDLVEPTEPLRDVPEPGQKDFWEGESWEWLGKISFVALPAILLLAVLIGAFAAKTYDTGATTYLKQPSSPESTAELFTDKLPKP